MRLVVTIMITFATALSARATTPTRPNVLLVVVDDAGYSDLGTYGGDASTPVIDALAARGTKLARFYTSPQCGPSRAMLLTGSDNHDVGIGTINEALSPNLRDLPAYSMRLAPESLTLAERLNEAGYYTVATGKWGIGKPGSSLPGEHGFDRSHVLDASGADNWEQKSYIPHYETAPWWADGKPIKLPRDFYSSSYIVDRTIDLLNEAPPNAPFFAFVGFQAIHLPLQVAREYTERYSGRFDAGWDEHRRKRAARTKALGLVPEGSRLAPMPKNARPWASLDEDDRALYAQMMQVSAGMLEAMDAELGRLIGHLDKISALENTIVVVVSDNGPEYGELPAEHHWLASLAKPSLIDRLGEKGTTASIGPEWATVSAAPFSLFKFHSSEGGLRVPFIIAGPGVPKTPVVHARGHITDVVPTILDLVGVEVTPSAQHAPPLRGRSLRPALVGEVSEVYGLQDPVGVEVAGNAALYRGPYKIVKMTLPHGDGTWRLYDITKDPGETKDLSRERPKLTEEMKAAYAEYAKSVGAVEMDISYRPTKQIAINGVKALLARHTLWWALALALLVGGFFLRRRKLASGLASE